MEPHMFYQGEMLTLGSKTRKQKLNAQRDFLESSFMGEPTTLKQQSSPLHTHTHARVLSLKFYDP